MILRDSKMTEKLINKYNLFKINLVVNINLVNFKDQINEWSKLR